MCNLSVRNQRDKEDEVRLAAHERRVHGGRYWGGGDVSNSGDVF